MYDLVGDNRFTLLAVRRRIRSQTCRQCLPHLKHSRRFVSSSMTPPHSGHRQFTIADIASGPRCCAGLTYNLLMRSVPVDCRTSPRSTSVPLFRPAIWRPFGSSARNTAEYLFASSCRMALTSLGVKRTVKPTSAVEQPTPRNPRRGYK